ncbi:MAG: tRNA epoxyqueuosine(34) reductase QueG [Chloroflexi bacterium]|jgi:epoxyqueuosine reductase|nr:tRNA epoxyqueuosine(34) reductase QueG [Chloroflexota bacterium]MQG10089.1 tRNA epoxyqueuosine(34) reductase QueG [SAR202 cluster bacterium]MQG53871.1 tRNA epoxyqueuosine(34) reductase QueG [SAR202 cluster bacterium]|tara:strand:- start:2202 stop:3353 length:1152 start_codon:yes stop_codon:yes gene_type:complete
MLDLKRQITEYAMQCGFDLVRITRAGEFAQDRDVALTRIKSGQMDGLPWYTESRVRRGADPQTLLPGARSIICLGLSYLDDETPTASGGKVARYASVKNYHRAMKRRMKALVRGLEERLESSIKAKWYVDDGPMLDRAAAARSGLGWFGKSTNILTPSHGSWVLLGQVITDLDLEPDPALQKACGACVRCIDDCPTSAIIAPFILDNARCISYQTIENRGVIPLDMRPLIGDWVFGCDICQDVCPVNRKAEKPLQPIEKAGAVGPSGKLDLAELLALSEEEFRARFQGTSIMRAKRVDMQKNACVALGNNRDTAGVPALVSALKNAEPLVRGHAAWALGQMATTQAIKGLEQSTESDPYVLEEIAAAIKESRRKPSQASSLAR